MAQHTFALLGYVGGPGPELIPYFMALLSFVGVALLAVLQWPVSMLLGYVSKIRRRGGQSNRPPQAGPSDLPNRDVSQQRN
ncbi:MAG TPA: hypothetical protein VHC22_15260 [Pirellulales bacterium]|nr:hypothetical protein [Pirellulales bacterium]